jgi:hypothetical protein
MNNLIGRTILAALWGVVLVIAGVFVTHFTLPPLSALLFAHPLISWLLFSIVPWLLLRNHKSPLPPASPSTDFTPTFKHEKIAIDTNKNQMWVKPTVGKPMVIARGDILGWNHEWEDAHNAFGMLFHVKNKIVFRIRDLEKPTVTVNFGRAHLTAKEWQARLTNWINH